jgi:hypothetical protein
MPYCDCGQVGGMVHEMEEHQTFTNTNQNFRLVEFVCPYCGRVKQMKAEIAVRV